MQGYILNITKAKNEDLIVTILTEENLYTLYRFYGARHSTINLGYKIDFVIEHQIGYMDRLRQITHLGFGWLKEFDRVMVWQRFVTQLYRHLRGIEHLDPFYYHLLEDLAKRFFRQNPKRAIVEGYVRLLKFEGRLHDEPICFVCEGAIREDPVIVRAFLPAHTHCIPEPPVNRRGLKHLFRYDDSQYLADEEIEQLFGLIMQGL